MFAYEREMTLDTTGHQPIPQPFVRVRIPAGCLFSLTPRLVALRAESTTDHNGMRVDVNARNGARNDGRDALG